MVVFKFGGASIQSTDRIQLSANIIEQHFTTHLGKPLFLVVSAMGKTTNALEKIAEAFFAKNKDEALALYQEIKDHHLAIVQNLLGNEADACEEHLSDIFTEAEWLLHDRPVRNYDYYYDQIVCFGELLSTIIFYHFLLSKNLPVEWLDARDLIRTDSNFRDANVDWDFTTKNVVSKHWANGNVSKIFITQGFIGATADNESTTLGREGSDYTAAIFANLLQAENLTIWKDVASVMNADPKLFPDVRPLPELNYDEIIEMAYYGAQVIHPKTIKPLYEKNIPLYVKCFLDTNLPGTIISSQPVKNLPPIIAYKSNQALLQLSAKDYSFTGEHTLGKLYSLFEKLSIRPTLTQSGAIHFWFSMDDKGEKTEQLALAASELFHVKVEKGLTLLTVRHYQEVLVNELTKDKTIVLQQQTNDTVQVLMR